jgi:hypothetical protein
MATPVWFYEGHAWRIFTELQAKEAGWRAANVTKARGGVVTKFLGASAGTAWTPVLCYLPARLRGVGALWQKGL